MIEDLRLQLDDITESAATTPDTTDSAADGPAMTAAFEDLLVEIDRLRKVSNRIEILADKHPAMEDGLDKACNGYRNPQPGTMQA